MRLRTFLSGWAVLATSGLLGCAPETEPHTSAFSLEPSLFQTPLAIPPLLEPTLDGDRKVFDLVAQHGKTEFLPGLSAPTTGYNGAYLGPTLRLREGDDVRLQITNLLDEPHATRLHGAHIPPDLDGGPHHELYPGESSVADFTVRQRASTLWYHPHSRGETAQQSFSGLAGMIWIDDDASDALGLPSRYGIDDIPIILQDRSFDQQGHLDYYKWGSGRQGQIGDTYVLNGTVRPYLEAEANYLRLRILNASNGRGYRLQFTDGTPFQLIAVDRSLRETPLTLTSLMLTAGERAEIVVDLGDRLGEVLTLIDVDSPREVMEIRVTEEATTTSLVPDELATLEHFDEADAQRTRTFELLRDGGSLFINLLQYDPDVINEVVPLNQVEVWELTNPGNMRFNFHKHGAHFEVISRNGGPPDAIELGYKDTVVVDSRETVRILVKHLDYADDAVPFLYHSHVMEHTDRGMMGQFLVVE